MPEFWRPVGYGAAFIVLWVGALGGFYAIPVLLVVMSVRSAHPMADLARVALMFTMAILGGGLAGLSYTLVGRPLRSIRDIGPYLAGITTVAPYLLMLPLMLRIDESKPFWGRFESEDWTVLGILIVIFGLVLGHGLFRERNARRPRSSSKS